MSKFETMAALRVVVGAIYGFLMCLSPMWNMIFDTEHIYLMVIHMTIVSILTFYIFKVSYDMENEDE